MFQCVECGYESAEFKAAIDGLSQGAFTYHAKCPRCNSRRVKHIRSHFENSQYEKDLRIKMVKKRVRSNPVKMVHSL